MKVIRPVETETSRFQVGDMLPFTLVDGALVQALAVKEERDGMLFVTVDCTGIESMVCSPGEQDGGYERSLLRRRLNCELLERFPPEIRAQMVPLSNGDWLRLPTVGELFGRSAAAEEADLGSGQWEPMRLCRNRVCFLGRDGISMCYWLADPVDGDGKFYSGVDYMGNAMHIAAIGTYGVRPVFKLR